MKRRKFLSNVIMMGGAFPLISFDLKKNSSSGQSQLVLDDNDFVTEPAKRIKVIAKADVIVVGGGPAGVAASIAAARGGAETYLIERYNHLGGLWTGGLVLPLLSTHSMAKSGKRIRVIYGLAGEMWERMHDMKLVINDVNPTIDPEAGKYVLEQMVSDAGVHVLYHSLAAGAIMDGNAIKGAYIESKSGRQAILAKVIIDCTGDGDVFDWAGEQYETIQYAIGLNYRIGNIDKINKKAVGYKVESVGEPTPIDSVNWVNIWGDIDQDALDVENLSRIQMKYRKQAFEHIQEIKKIPGYEHIFLLDTASQIGTRLSRVLDGEYQLTLKDTMTWKTFKDSIGCSGAWCTMKYNNKKVFPGERPFWHIPYRSLIPRHIDNLIVGGRCFCFERELGEDARIIGTCLVTGQGAGAGAAIAVKDGVRPRDIDPEKLHKLLIEQKVWFGE
ncbi:MAG: FAD-dependent oxidoreductase [Phocaeicola sp.]|uniref:FAD-dependent oxidoreductase n=2 Tax=Phocaeicola sp. TaxID=2773926 RepID=UPI003FA03BED